jgi:hypothetical protein
MPPTETPVEKKRRRQRSARTIAPIGIVLVALGVFVATRGGTVGLLGFLVLMQGVGLLAAALPLAIGHNPLDRD